MADLPILFSALMVRAILREIEQPGTGKTQTRRTFHHKKNIPSGGAWHQPFPDAVPNGWVYADRKRAFDTMRSRYCVGDRLYVREGWCSDTRNDSVKPHEIEATEPIWFSADGAGINLTDWSLKSSKTRPAMFMPKWASRITLIVTDVRVERLQDISAEDARDEGVDRKSRSVRQIDLFGASSEQRAAIYLQACRWEFETLWDSLNGDRPGCAWSDNPWIAAYTFRPILGNIDQIEVE